jgi:hypothetical protein
MTRRAKLVAIAVAVAGFIAAAGWRDQFGKSESLAVQEAVARTAAESGRKRGYADRMHDRLPDDLAAFIGGLSGRVEPRQRALWEEAFRSGYVRGVSDAAYELHAAKAAASR